MGSFKRILGQKALICSEVNCKFRNPLCGLPGPTQPMSCILAEHAVIPCTTPHRPPPPPAWFAVALPGQCLCLPMPLIGCPPPCIPWQLGRTSPGTVAVRAFVLAIQSGGLANPIFHGPQRDATTKGTDSLRAQGLEQGFPLNSIVSFGFASVPKRNQPSIA